MYPRPLRRQQQGFALVAAIFIVVVLAGLAAYAVSISSTQHAGLALDIQGGRALQAARAGMDWGVARVVAAPTAFGAGNCQSAPVTINLSTGGAGRDLPAFNGFTVTVSCTATAYTDGVPLFSYALVATACSEPQAGSCPNTSNPGPDYVERRLSTQIVCSASGPC